MLRFYFITDDGAAGFPPVAQAEIALAAGATVVQYRNKAFALERYGEVEEICALCRDRAVPFIVNDNILLAKAVGADGVHLGQDDAPPALARKILGPDAIIGLSVSNLSELARSDLSVCDYVGSGPVYFTGTKADAKPVRGLTGLREMVENCPLPVVGIGGITAENAPGCLRRGAAGVAVISYITRAASPGIAAERFAAACAQAGPDGRGSC